MKKVLSLLLPLILLSLSAPGWAAGGVRSLPGREIIKVGLIAELTGDMPAVYRSAKRK